MVRLFIQLDGCSPIPTYRIVSILHFSCVFGMKTFVLIKEFYSCSDISASSPIILMHLLLYSCWLCSSQSEACVPSLTNISSHYSHWQFQVTSLGVSINLKFLLVCSLLRPINDDMKNHVNSLHLSVFVFLFLNFKYQCIPLGLLCDALCLNSWMWSPLQHNSLVWAHIHQIFLSHL